ncbi:MAG: ATP-binding cassette domain-containing protein [Sulfuricurvum sp.]|uniref:ABC transporter ATP-binding protein n=1 Tax=Sulfuricurvum sp. TaxID=2025608 RepID=UPI00260E8DFB|nr:ATP-binding cassette domain-containing protein [Sulfuricurvum sp.]MDD2829589.1 ATP-binding cassette domain-containing protein [Sulfuricurvum sp.]MDD4950364.1 ATP-binding cassette domain-containing protein [Sulfuricurvum sp.]
MNQVVFFENIELRYDVTPVLKNITLSIEQGEHCVILGANGSGKSSLIKLINCELYPSIIGGECRHEILGHERWVVTELRKHLGVVTNDLHTRFAFDCGYLSGFETVLSGFYGTIGLFDHLQNSKDQMSAAESAMERLGIVHLRDKRVDQMSTGELRKCIVARALVHPIRAILLDEPTVGLDIKAQLDFIEMMRSLARSGTTVILVTHHIEEVFEEIQKAVLIKEGMIVVEGKKEEVLNSDNLSYTFNTPLEIEMRYGRYSIHSKM